MVEAWLEFNRGQGPVRGSAAQHLHTCTPPHSHLPTRMPPQDDRPIGTNYSDKGPKPERGRYGTDSPREVVISLFQLRVQAYQADPANAIVFFFQTK